MEERTHGCALLPMELLDSDLVQGPGCLSQRLGQLVRIPLDQSLWDPITTILPENNTLDRVGYT